jgi:hypothetical protein
MGLTTIQEGDIYRAAHTTRRRTTTTSEVDDAMGIKTEQRKFARAAERNWEATVLEELHGAHTPENSTVARTQRRIQGTRGNQGAGTRARKQGDGHRGEQAETLRA